MSEDDDTCPICHDNFWTLVDQGGISYAESCRECKPNEYEAMMSGKWRTAKARLAYFAQRDNPDQLTPEQAKERDVAKAKARFGI